MPSIKEFFTKKYCNNCNKKKQLIEYDLIKCYVEPTYRKICKICLEKMRNQPSRIKRREERRKK